MIYLQVDMLIAMGENMIQMRSSTDMQKLEGLTDASANAKSEPSHNLDSNNLEFAHHIRFVSALILFMGIVDIVILVRCCPTSYWLMHMDRLH